MVDFLLSMPDFKPLLPKTLGISCAIAADGLPCSFYMMLVPPTLSVFPHKMPFSAVGWAAGHAMLCSSSPGAQRRRGYAYRTRHTTTQPRRTYPTGILCCLPSGSLSSSVRFSRFAWCSSSQPVGAADFRPVLSSNAYLIRAVRLASA